MTKRNALFASLLCLLLLSTACAPGTARTPVNSLPENLPACAVFQNGAVYFLKNGVLSLAAEDVYDPDAGVIDADYAADPAQERFLFCRNETLFLAQDGVCETVGANVRTWRASAGLDTIVFLTPWREARDDSLGTLFCRCKGVLQPLDEGVLLSSLTLSANGNVLYALKPNDYPKTGARLIRYDVATGEKREVLSACSSVFWVSEDGESVICAEKSGEETYDYTIYTDSFRKSLTEKDGFLPSVTSDGRVLYLLCRYRSGAGELDRIDLSSLSCKTLARDVAFFSIDAVTDPLKGAVYSVRTKEETYSFYYARANGSAVRLMREAPAQAIRGIAIDSRRETGYLLAPGAYKQDCALYRVSLSGDSVDAVRLAGGEMSDLTYFEETDAALVLKNASHSGGELLLASGETVTSLGSCAALDGRALCAASDDMFLIFTDLSEQACGTMRLGSRAAQTEIAQNVPVSETLAPVACRRFTSLYYLSADEDGTYSLFYAVDGDARLIAERVQGLTALFEAE